MSDAQGPELEPDLPVEKPLAAARRRMDREDRAKKARAKGEYTQDIALGMVAAGLPATKVARALDLNTRGVQNLAAAEAETIRDIRERLKFDKTKAMSRVEARLWPRLERDIDKADAKDIDALSRAAMNLEKIQAQVSGEAQQVNVRQTSDAPNLDLKILINTLLGGQ